MHQDTVVACVRAPGEQAGRRVEQAEFGTTTNELQQRTREAQRLDKILQDAGVKLSPVASDIVGISGRRILAAPASGDRDPR